MKKLFSAFALVLLLGAGCIGKTTPETVTGDWYLAFDLPEGWVMIPGYQDGDQAITSEQVTKETSDIAIQNTTKTILSGGAMPDDFDESSRETGPYMIIRVYRLSQNRLLPDEAEDLGNGFFKVHLCDDGEDCEIYGGANDEYYFVGTNDKFQFVINHSGIDQDVAEDIILSAKEVTQFNQ